MELLRLWSSGERRRAARLATEHSLVDDQLEGRRATRGVRLLYLAGERLGRRTIAVSEAESFAIEALS